MNTLVAKAGTLHPTIATFTAQIPTITCNEENGFIVMKVLASIEIVAYVLLWLKPASGAFLLTVFMSFALHFHLVFLKDPIKALALQLVLVCASFIVWALEVQVGDAVSAKAVKPPPPVKVDRSKAPFGKGRRPRRRIDTATKVHVIGLGEFVSKCASAYFCYCCRVARPSAWPI